MTKIGIIGAMELEVEQLKAAMQTRRVENAAGMEFYEGVLNGADVVVVRSGVGKVNAGMCTQILADRFQVTHVINTGVAGSLNAALEIGDILISTDAVHHDVDATVFGYRPGEVPQLGIWNFEADKRLAELAEQSCRRVNPELGVHQGRVLSGDQFISSDEVKQGLIDGFCGDCVEMEGAAIAQTARLNGIPFVVIRAISDKADHSAEVDYPAFEREAAKHSARLVEDMVRNI